MAPEVIQRSSYDFKVIYIYMHIFAYNFLYRRI